MQSESTTHIHGLKTILHECFGVLCAPFYMTSTSQKHFSIIPHSMYPVYLRMICISFYTLYIISDLYFKYQKYVVKRS